MSFAQVESVRETEVDRLKTKAYWGALNYFVMLCLTVVVSTVTFSVYALTVDKMHPADIFAAM